MTQPISKRYLVVGLAAVAAMPAFAETQPSIERLTRAARGGDKVAMYQLGLRYLHGDGVTQDARAALVWFRSTVYGPNVKDSGYAPAEAELAIATAAGNGAPANPVDAWTWYALAATNDAQYAPAANEMAARLTPDELADGRYELALKLADGVGAPADRARALQLFRQAAEPGFREAQHMVGFMYDKGLGTPADTAEAARWYRKAADQGYATAQHNMGSLYELGDGVERDVVEAWMWYYLSSRIETYFAGSYLKLQKAMTPEQIAAGRARADAWRPTEPVRSFQALPVHAS